MTNKQVTVQGYEVFKASSMTLNLKQFYHSGFVNQETEFAMYYDVDTKTQQSGSPVISLNSQGRIEIVGIHKGYNRRINLNVGTKFTDKTMKNINNWALELGTSLTNKTVTTEEVITEPKTIIEDLNAEQQ